MLEQMPQLADKLLEAENDFSDSPFHERATNIALSLISSEAERQGFQVRFYGKLVFDVSKDGSRVAFLQNSPENSAVYHYCAKRKGLAKLILGESEVPVPEGAEFRDRDKALEYFSSCQWPVVLKPTDRAHGTGVTTGVESLEQFEKAWAFATEYDDRVIVEKCLDGYDLRVIVIGGRAVSAYARIPASVIGDGKRSIRELVEEKNQRRLKNPSARLSPIRRFDVLERIERPLEDVPARGEYVQLSSVANVSAGGDAVQVIDDVDPGVLKIALQAAGCFPGLAQVGVDLIVNECGSGIDAHVIEINANPTISSSVFPTYGRAINVPDLLLAYAFREGRQVRSNPEGPRSRPARPYGLTVDLRTFATGRYQQKELVSQAAYRAGLAVQTVSSHVFEVKGPERSVLFYKGMPDQTSVISLKITRDRQWVNEILSKEALLGVEQFEQSMAPSQYRFLVIDGCVTACLYGGRYRGNGGERCEYDDIRVDVTDLLHEGFVDIICRAAGAVFNPYLAGIDLLAEDISADPGRQQWRLMDIVCNPSLALHHFPTQGVGRDVASSLVRALFPGSTAGERQSRCVHATAFGQLKGVGYCNWVRRKAVLHGVAGWVRCRADGAVEMLLQGPEPAVRALLDLARSGYSRAPVTDFSFQDHELACQFGFSVYR